MRNDFKYIIWTHYYLPFGMRFHLNNNEQRKNKFLYLYIYVQKYKLNSYKSECKKHICLFLMIYDFEIRNKKQTGAKENHTDKKKRQKLSLFQHSCRSLPIYPFHWVSTERANVFMVLNTASSHIRLPVNLPLDMFFPLAGYKTKGNARLNKLNAIHGGK